MMRRKRANNTRSSRRAEMITQRGCKKVGK